MICLIGSHLSLFSVVKNKDDSASQLNNDVDKVTDWLYIYIYIYIYQRCLLTQIPRSKHENCFLMKLYKWGSSSHVLIMHQSPRLPFKNILGCFLIKISVTAWLYVLIMSQMCFRVNLHSLVAIISRNSFLRTGAISQV